MTRTLIWPAVGSAKNSISRALLQFVEHHRRTFDQRICIERGLDASRVAIEKTDAKNAFEDACAGVSSLWVSRRMGPTGEGVAANR